MWKKTYGKTGKDISVIAFGGMRFPKPDDIDGSAELITYAHSKGINYFDTAPFYCDDKSEEITGAALKQLPRDSFYVSTKCAATDGAELRSSLERSLKRLNVQQIDFFHIWCLIFPNQLPERVAKGAVAAAQKAKEEGLIKHLVVSTHLKGEDIATVLDSGYFEGVTLGYNVLNFPFRAKGVEAAAKHNVGLVTMNPLGGALVGFASKDEVDQAVAAVENFKPHSAEHIEKVKSHLTASFEGFCTGCGYCLPCPSDVEIPKLMDAYNMKILDGKDEAIKDRLKWHWSLAPDAAAACIQCSDCESRCTQHLPIRERLEAIAALAGNEVKGS